MRILMVGPIEKSGGVSTHTQMLSKELSKKGILVELYNTSPKKEKKWMQLNIIIKLFRKSFGISSKILQNYKNVDLVHVQVSSPMGGFIPAFFASCLKIICKYNLAITYHSPNEKFVKRHKKLMRLVLARLELFILVSEIQKPIILKYLGKEYENKIVVIPNGYDAEKFRIMEKDSIRKLLDLPRDCRIIVHVANLVERKGQRYLIEAMDIIVKKYKYENVRCFVIGRGYLYDSLLGIIENLSLTNYVTITGWISSQNIALYMNAADLFVFPSLRGAESFGIVQIEAMGCGKPVVATKNGGSEEIIISEDYGLLCEPANSKDLADKILIALEKDWDREKILRYVKRFTWENIANNIIEVYRTIL